MDPIITASERRCYKNAHSYHVNSISVCSDGQHFISADDLRINMWNLDRQKSFSASHLLPSRQHICVHSVSTILRSQRDITHVTHIHKFCCCWQLASHFVADILDIKPVNMDDLTEVITAATYHPTKCNLFMYSSSCGKVKLADHRQSALCDNHFTCRSSELGTLLRSHFFFF